MCDFPYQSFSTIMRHDAWCPSFVFECLTISMKTTLPEATISARIRYNVSLKSLTHHMNQFSLLDGSFCATTLTRLMREDGKQRISANT